MKKAVQRLLISTAFCTLVLLNIQCMDESTKEIWKDVVGWEGLYRVSSHGSVFSVRKKILLKSSNVAGYRQVILCRDSKMSSGRVHRLVAMAFIPNPDNKPEVNHIDGNKSHNYFKNLEWVTSSENVSHTYKSLGRVPRKGQQVNTNILTPNQVIQIRAKYIPYKYSYKKLGDEYGVDQSAIYLIIKRRNWKHLA